MNKLKEPIAQGLSKAEVLAKREVFGWNELPSSKPRSHFRIAFSVVKEPMFLLLIACSLLYILMGDIGEGLILSVAVLLVIVITFVQERRTERTLESLRDLTSPRALILRDGVWARLPAKELVPADTISVSEGDRIPADSVVLTSKSIRVDESLLTGESAPVSKFQQELSSVHPDNDHVAVTSVYSGTLVVQGSAHLKVFAIGSKTEIGKIGLSLKGTTHPESGLSRESKRVVLIVAGTSLLVSAIIALMWWLRDGQLVRGILWGLTFAMSTIPEEFPVVLTVFLALGAWRISKKLVLARDLGAIESLGAATYLCSDKTGTLTENRMEVHAGWTAKEGAFNLDETGMIPSGGQLTLLRYAGLASDPASYDPMDKASVDKALQAEAGLFQNRVLIRSFPLERPILAVAHIWKVPEEESGTIFCKGAAESVLNLCRVPVLEAEEVMASAKAMAQGGYRVLAVAGGTVSPIAENADLKDQNLKFEGLIGFSDPIRAGVPSAVRQCHEAGIKVLLITGDYSETALAVARSIGLENVKDVLTGNEVNLLSEEELSQRLLTVRVLARMVPEHKLKIVNALRKSGEVVAMTGDGVNDAPALKAADIGIAMGGRGTDVAREASGLVLVNDDFNSIVDSICLGRRIYDNIQKAISYIIAVHIPIVGLTVTPLILGMDPILWPVHLAFLELIIDPVCSIVFEAEPEERNVMARPPRNTKSRLFNRETVSSGIIQGIVVLLAVWVVFIYVNRIDASADHARAVSFATLIIGNMALIFTLRSRSESAWALFAKPHPTLIWVLSSVLTMAGLILFQPTLTRLFHFTSPHFLDFALGFGVIVLSLAGFDLWKLRKRQILVKV
ncbi:MAG: cation-translocating P-type ATPase [Chitinophagaceae bacterium]|nr:cation-translocating P-type ATPase [Oligoflexus sp.]